MPQRFLLVAGLVLCLRPFGWSYDCRRTFQQAGASPDPAEHR